LWYISGNGGRENIFYSKKLSLPPKDNTMDNVSAAPPYLQTHKNRFTLSIGTIAIFAVLAMVFIMGLIKIYSPDLGFHLRSAREILDKGFIYTDTFSYGSNGHPYYDLQWIFQLVVYTLYNMGQPVLVITNALLITFSIALAWRRSSKYPSAVPQSIKVIIFAVIALLLVQGLTFDIRPHVLSWICMNLLLLALESYKRGKQKAVFFLPAIMLFWVNTHSLAVLGLVIIGIYNAGLFIENKKADKKLLMFSALALAAFLINPYFFDGLFFPFKQFGFISDNGGMYKAYIYEMHSPFASSEIKALGKGYFTHPLFLTHLSALVAVLCIIRSLKQKNFTDTLLLAAFLFLLDLGFKNYGYYLMVVLPLTVKYVTNWLERRQIAKQGKTLVVATVQHKKKEKNRKEEVPGIAPVFSKKKYYGLAIATIVIAAFVSLTSINDGYPIYLNYNERSGLTENEQQLPVGAADFIVKNNIKGKILNHFNDGGYLMAHTGAKVFIDGRIELMNDDFFMSYLLSLNDINGVKILMDSYNPDIVVFPYMGAMWWQYFLTYKEASGYKPAYFDGLSAVYLKSSAFPNIPQLTEQMALKGLDVNDLKKLGPLIREPEKPSGFAMLLQSTWKKQVLPADDMARSAFCFANGFETAGVLYSARCLERATMPVDNVIYQNLAYYFRQRKMDTEAQICEDRVLKR
jgi:hypothetical protein